MKKSPYHSRSPDELRNYLDRLHNNKKKRSWVRIILYFDLFILMLVLYYLFIHSNPGSEYTNISNRKNFGSLQFYFSKAGEYSLENAQYFIFLKNTKNVVFLEQKIQGKYELFYNDMPCYDKVLELQIPKLNPYEEKYLTFSVEPLNPNTPQICQNLGKKKIWQSVFRNLKKSYRSMISLNLQDGSSEYAEINNERW